MHLLTLYLCVVIAITQAQFLDTNFLQQFPLLNGPVGQQFLKGLQSISSFQQGHGSGLQFQDLNGPPGKPGGQNGGLKQSGFGGSQQNNERQEFNGHPPPPPPFGGQQQRPGFGNNQQQQGFNRPPPPPQQTGSHQQQQNFGQQSGYGGAQSQSHTGPVQTSAYSFVQNTQGSPSNFGNIHSNEDDNEGYQQFHNFYQYGNSDEQEDNYVTNNNQNADLQHYNTFYQFGNSGELDDNDFEWFEAQDRL